jgi:hypothetical protein
MKHSRYLSPAEMATLATFLEQTDQARAAGFKPHFPRSLWDPVLRIFRRHATDPEASPAVRRRCWEILRKLNDARNGL